MDLSEIDDAYPPTPVQRGMLFHSLESRQSDIYVSYVTIDLQGELDMPLFKKAWQKVALRHDSLRASFLWDGLEEPLLLVHKDIELPWSVESWQTLTETEQMQRFQRVLAGERNSVIDPGQAPLQRFQLIQSGQNQWKVVWSIHHLLADGWSTPIILEDLLIYYSALRCNEPPIFSAPPFRFADHVNWLNTRDTKTALTYWRQLLDGTSPIRLHLPAPDHLSIKENDDGLVTQLSHSYSVSETDALTRFCRNHRLTLGGLMHAAWSLLLRSYCDSPRVLFGSTSAGRSAELSGVQSAVGVFFNTIPIAVDVPDDAILQEWLLAVQRVLQSSLQFDYTPLSDIQSLVTRSGGEPLFETIVVVESHSSDVELITQDRSLRLKNIEYMTHSNFPLALLIYPGERLRLTLVYDKKRFHRQQIESVLTHLVALLDDMRAHPTSALRDINARLTDPAPLQSLYTGQALRSGPVDTMHAWLESVCDRYASNIALISGDRSITYRQLDERANQIARLLMETGSVAGSLIGVQLPRSIDQIAALFAVLKTGAAYVPVDISYPADRVQQIIEDSGLARLLTSFVQPDESAYATVKVQQVADADDFPVTRFIAENNVKPSLAYVMYTSGSTGRAKGVCITHSNLVYSTNARVTHFKLDAPRFLLLSSIAFDSSVAGIYGTLCSGGQLVLPAQEQEKDLDVIADLIERHKVTHTLCLPSLYQLLLEFAPEEKLKSLRAVSVAGEACRPAVSDLHHDRMQHARLYNEYGPTEATVWCTVHEIGGDDGALIPIGNPIAGAQIMILDSQQKPCLPGVEGELCIGGPGVALGYHRDKKLTAEKFIPNAWWPGRDSVGPIDQPPRLYRTGDLAYWRPDGVLVFTGRADRQLKIRGYRLEPAEIELIILRHAQITDAVVVAHQPPAENDAMRSTSSRGVVRTQLVAYYTLLTDPADEAESSDIKPIPGIDEQELRKLVCDFLPEYMCPSVWMPLNQLPRLPNGKLDHHRIPLPVTEVRGDTSMNTTADEPFGTLARILGGLLGSDDIRPGDNFFELGGDSITAIQFVSRAREAGLSLDIAAVTLQPTLAATAALQSCSEQAVTDISPYGSTPLTPIQAWFFSLAHPHPAHWNVGGVLQFQRPLDASLLEKSIYQTLSRHPALGASFVQADGNWSTEIPSSSPPGTLVHDGGADLSLSDAAMVVTQLQQEFQLESGWMIGFQIVGPTSDNAGALIWVAHHLVIDVLSADTLFSEIATDYRILEDAGRVTNRPNPSISLRDWAYQLQAFTATLDVQSIPDPDLIPPSDSTHATEQLTEADCVTLQTELDEDSTTRLIDANSMANSGTHELILLALGMALCESLHTTQVGIDLEHHGRDVLGAKVDTSQSIGWFTTFYPFRFTLPSATDWHGRIKNIKEICRTTHSEEKYYLLKRYASDPSVTKVPSPTVLFNFQGGHNQAASSSAELWQHSPGLWECLRAPENKRPYDLEINARVVSGNLRIYWRYLPAIISTQVLQSTAESTERHLQEIGSAVSDSDTSSFTPSDFPDVVMDQGQLDRFLDSIE